MDIQAIHKFLRDHCHQIVAETVALAEHESPSRDTSALRGLAEMLSRRLSQLSGTVESHEDASGGPHILARFPGQSELRPALVLGHFDTVWPIGTLERMPVAQDEGCLRGPGVYDMKASLAIFHAVLEAFQAFGLQPPRPIVALYTSDEEIGSPGSRPIIEGLARLAEHVLVLEPPLADGSLKTARKGVGRFTIEVEGKAAHAGVAPERGRSAVVELAHQILRAHALNDPAVGTTVNIGLIEGGTTANVVPARALAEVDVRATTLAAAQAVEQSLRALQPVTRDTRIKVSGSFNRPPMERTAASAALFDKARAIGAGLDLNLTEGSTGGGSDGNFTAALGVPTLDGLGSLGGGAHADDEHVVIASLPDRAALLAALLLNL
ncbi:MAG: M20 family metallopeptidase [Isosphaeraceae bacterium]